MKALGILVILFNLIFAQEIKSDSSALNPLNLLKRQNLLYSAGENWIPPSLPSESECISGGCCLMPLGGFFIMREALKQEVPLESLQPAVKPKFSIGISYSPGIAYAGMLGRRLETGEMDPFHDLYWNNILEINARYYFNPNWALGVGGGYMWTHLQNRSSFLRIPVEPYEEPWSSSGLNEWDIWSSLGSVNFKFNMIHKPNRWFVSGGLEYYYSNGSCIEEHTRYNHQTGGPDVRTISGSNYSKGYGCLISLGIEKSTLANLSWNGMFTFRYGLAKNYKQETEQKDVIWFKPVDFHLTGIYVNVGINYNFLRKGG